LLKSIAIAQYRLSFTAKQQLLPLIISRTHVRDDLRGEWFFMEIYAEAQGDGGSCRFTCAGGKIDSRIDSWIEEAVDPPVQEARSTAG
jgi:hypothetical protein